MLVSIKLYATLRGYQPRDGVLQVEEGVPVKEVLHSLGVPLDEAKVVFVNGRHASLEQEIRDGDKLAAFPAVGGG